ncbi:MAG: sodium:proton antiporter [Pseudomonadota bacterium]
MEYQFDKISVMLLVAGIVAMLARRLRLPYTVGLALCGVALAFVPHLPALDLTKELIFSVLLPPLIFEAALFLPWRELRKVLPFVLVTASAGLLLSAGATAAAMHYLLGWPWLAAGIFGVLIGATDPVSVIATFKDAGVKGTLRMQVESESLFNDGTAAVLFGLLLAFAGGSAPSAAGVARDALLTIGGGIGAGVLVAALILYLAGKTTDHLVELNFTMVAAYGSFLLAEHFHCSGVLATLCAGLIVGNRGPLGAISPKGREAVEAFWEFAAFVANSLIFLLIGMREARQDFSTLILPTMAAIVFVLCGRALAIYPIAALFQRSAQRVPLAHQHILVWGGLRGALALALALGLPASLPYQSQIVTITFGVVAFSIVVQGLTVTPLLRKLGLIATGDAH